MSAELSTTTIVTVQEGVAEAERGETKYLGSFSQYIDDTPWWTLNGFWVPNGEKYTSHQQALSWQVAWDLAQLEVQQVWEGAGQTGPAQLRWTGVFPGKHFRVDTYRFLDPEQTE